MGRSKLIWLRDCTRVRAASQPSGNPTEDCTSLNALVIWSQQFSQTYYELQYLVTIFVMRHKLCGKHFEGDIYMLSQKDNLLGVLPYIAQKLKWGVALGLLLAALGSTASAAPVVVGSVNPQTNRVTIFEDLMVKTFSDGGRIQYFHGGYGAESRSYFLVRAGKSASGGCRTEVFRLVRLANNRLAIADSSNPSIAWNPQILSNMFATFDCTSSDCLFCVSGNQDDPLGSDPESGCACDQGTGSFAGKCESVRPGTLSYTPPQIVTPGL